MERLAKEKIAAQNRILLLKRELSSSLATIELTSPANGE
jgi:hypothetical protein